MDEPLGALDKKLRERCSSRSSRSSRELGVTIIYVTHDQEEALVMSDRIAVMNDGRIEQLGPAMTSTTDRRHGSWRTSSASRTSCAVATVPTAPMGHG